jgi:hypothetical protein
MARGKSSPEMEFFCDDCVTNKLQFCDDVVIFAHEHRQRGHSVDPVLDLHGRHRGGLWRQRLVLGQGALADEIAAAGRQWPANYSKHGLDWGFWVF